MAPLGADVLPHGTLVDHFSVIRLLGRGGMGDVYLARDTVLGRKVALKFMREHRSDKHELVLREARATAKFSHPHIVGVFFVGHYEGRPYMALEYLDGQSLRERLDEGRPGDREAVRIALAISEALEEAHSHGVFHRDLKPDNVLVPKDGRVRVVDFGIAVVGGDQPEERQAVGTPAYMAPEQWCAEPVTGATDVWAFGVILFELLSGKRPYPTTTADELSELVLSDEPAPRLPGDEVSPALVDLVGRCLDKEEGRRPSAREVASVLREIVSPGANRRQDSPFRGLLAFTERHAEVFFGRDAEIAAFVERARESAVLPVVGASGVGKSSFVQAGVIPRLRENGPWRVIRLRPGAHPFRALARALLSGGFSTQSMPSADTVTQDIETDAEPPTPSAEEAKLAETLEAVPGHLAMTLRALAEDRKARVMVFVDQLEELFTLTENADERRSFLHALVRAADDASDPVRLCFTLRDDFLGRIGEDAEIHDAISRVTVLRTPGADALREILTGPLMAAGYGFDDPSLVDEMIAAVAGEPAGLPLVQFAIGMLWERRDRDRRLLLRREYDAIGGVGGALADHADGVLHGLNEDELRLVRDILLRLVTPEGARRVLTRPRLLEGLPTNAADVLARLVEARLITVSRSDAEAELELAHESLLKRWRRLARWIEEGQEELVFVADLVQAASLWEKRGCREEEVWQGTALVEAERTLARLGTKVPERAAGFLRASRARAQRAGLRRRRLISVVVSTLVLVALVLATATVFSVRQARRADEQARRADEQARRAERRFADVRQLANSLLFEVDEKVRELEGATAARELIVKRATTYLDDLAGEAEEDVGLARELGAAYIKVGDIQGNGFVPNLGRQQDALASYRRAEQILERLSSSGHDDPETMALLARVNYSFGFVSDDGAVVRTRLARALALTEALPEQHHVDKQTQLLGYVRLADTELSAGNAIAAQPHADKCVEIASAWAATDASEQARYWVAVAHEMRAITSAAAGDPDAAVNDIGHSRAVLAELVTGYPENVAFRREMAMSSRWHASFLSSVATGEPWQPSTGDPVGAETALRESLEIWERLVLADREDARAVADTAGALTQLALLTADQNHEEAVRLFQRAIGMLEALPPETRDSYYTRDYEWFIRCSMAETFARAGRRNDAVAAARSGLALAEPAGKAAGASYEAMLALAACRYAVARMWYALENAGEGAAHLELAATGLRGLVASRSRMITAYIGLIEVLAMIPGCAPRQEALAIWKSWPGKATPYTRRMQARLEESAKTCAD